MEKWKVAAVLVCFLLASQVIGAEPNSSTYLGLFKSSNFEIGPEIFHQRYSEPGLIKDSGMMYGLYWAYTYRGWLATPPSQEEGEEAVQPVAAKPGGKWMIGADGDIAYGQVDYDGAFMNGTPFKSNDLENWLIDARLLFGPDFPSEKRIDTIYTGLGFRYLNNDGPHDEGFYERESRYLYLPVGITTLGNLEQGWVLGATAEFDALLYGNQTSHLSDVGGSNISNSQHEGYAVRASIKFGKKEKNYSFMLEPFVRYWQVQTSEESGGGIEPENNTTEIGARAIWRF